MAGYVYLIGSHSFHWYKIGRSTSPHVRIRDIGILLPFRIEVVAVWKTNDYVYLESMLHRKYGLNHINGEWFHFQKQEIEALILDVPYTLVQFNSLSKFTNMTREYEPPKRINLPLTPEEKEWLQKHRAAWKAVSQMQDKEERRKASRKLISERKVHKLLLIQKKQSA